MRICCLIIFICVSKSWQISTPESQTYEAGVVEFNESTNGTNAERMLENLAQYLRIMDEAPQSLDIIVFPEMTLNNMDTAVETPEPEEKITPCDSLLNSTNIADQMLRNLSCSARNHQRYVVVDIITKAKCPDSDMIANGDPRDCSIRADKMSYYNTNVVFDRNGALISRYRKFNLFGEEVDTPHKPSMITFETDFGVKFGHFICFDLMFKQPALELVRSHNVTDIVFTTMWFSEAPFLTAVQIQQNWAYSLNVNLLASGANQPSIGSSGTGIYSGRKGPLVSVMEGGISTKLYSAIVPKHDLGANLPVTDQSIRYSSDYMKGIYLKREPALDDYTMFFLDDEQMQSTEIKNKTLCHDDLCCEFKYSFTTPSPNISHYSYALAVYHGIRTFDGFADGGILACAFIACQTKDIATCGLTNVTMDFGYDWNTLEISGTFPYGDQFFYVPSSLDPSIMPFTIGEFEYTTAMAESTNGSSEYIISMKKIGPKKHFYVFGIYGRDFNLDSAAGMMKASSMIFALLTATVAINLL